LPNRELRIRPLTGLPELREGDELGRLIADAASPAANEVVVVSQKAVSKVEGRVRMLADVEPSDRARALAIELDKDPAMVELVLAESGRIVRAERGILITETNDGWVCANAGIDTSNLEEGHVSLLPADGDASPGGSARPTSRSAARASRRWRTGAAGGIARGASSRPR